MSEQVQVSKGITALRLNNRRAERITMGGTTFYFRKLTIQMEEELDKIVKDNQDLTLKMPEKPPENSSDEALRQYADEFVAFKQKAAQAFRRLTAEIMKYVLLDETDAPFFAPDDDVYSLLNNVYAENFFKAYTKFRQGMEAGPAEAERRFQE